jgi:hypothetical protein
MILPWFHCTLPGLVKHNSFPRAKMSIEDDSTHSVKTGSSEIICIPVTAFVITTNSYYKYLEYLIPSFNQCLSKDSYFLTIVRATCRRA